jgi:hypothetical protein
MKKQILNLIMSVAIFTTSPLFAIGEEDPQRLGAFHSIPQDIMAHKIMRENLPLERVICCARTSKFFKHASDLILSKIRPPFERMGKNIDAIESRDIIYKTWNIAVLSNKLGEFDTFFSDPTQHYNLPVRAFKSFLRWGDISPSGPGLTTWEFTTGKNTYVIIGKSGMLTLNVPLPEDPLVQLVPLMQMQPSLLKQLFKGPNLDQFSDEGVLSFYAQPNIQCFITKLAILESRNGKKPTLIKNACRFNSNTKKLEQLMPAEIVGRKSMCEGDIPNQTTYINLIIKKKNADAIPN